MSLHHPTVTACNVPITRRMITYPPCHSRMTGELTASRTQRKSKLEKLCLGTLLMENQNKERPTERKSRTCKPKVSRSETLRKGEDSSPTYGEPTRPGAPSQCKTSHRVHKQLLAGLANALQGHVHILLARETIHAVIQGVRDGFGYLKTRRDKGSVRE